MCIGFAYLNVLDFIGNFKKGRRIPFLLSDSPYDEVKDCMNFLNEIDELTDEEKLLFNSRLREFIHMLETTGMVKSYKMPVLQAFYNGGDVILEIDEEAIYRSFKTFYARGSNGVGMLS